MYAWICKVHFWDEIDNKPVTKNYALYDNTSYEAVAQIADYVGDKNILDLQLNTIGEEGSLIEICDYEYESIVRREKEIRDGIR